MRVAAAVRWKVGRPRETHCVCRKSFGRFHPSRSTPALRTRVREVTRDGHARLLIDLEAVTAIDAAGIAALLEARRVLEAQAGGTLVLRANPVVCRALKDTGTIAAFALWTGHRM